MDYLNAKAGLFGIASCILVFNQPIIPGRFIYSQPSISAWDNIVSFYRKICSEPEKTIFETLQTGH
jgi:hypothetical protein